LKELDPIEGSLRHRLEYQDRQSLPGLVKKLEAQGYRRAYMRKSVFPALKQDILTIDFSGWPIFVRADLDDAIVTQMCAGLDARKHNIPWEGEGPLPVERMAREAPDTPQDIPLHPAAEKYWKSKGYL